MTQNNQGWRRLVEEGIRRKGKQKGPEHNKEEKVYFISFRELEVIRQWKLEWNRNFILPSEVRVWLTQANS